MPCLVQTFIEAGLALVGSAYLSDSPSLYMGTTYLDGHAAYFLEGEPQHLGESLRHEPLAP